MWNKEVDDAITAKRQDFKAWKAGKCIPASYNTAKRISRRVVHHARHEADNVVYDGIDHKSSDIFCLANQMRTENVDVVGDKPVKNDSVPCSSSLCWRPCHMSFRLVFPGRTYMRMILSSLLNL